MELLKKTSKIIVGLIILLTCGCSPFVPNNFLPLNSINHSQKINGKFCRPEVITINEELLRKNHFMIKNEEYRIGKRDQLTILVWEHPELSSAVTTISVNEKGEISFPYTGYVRVNGLTLQEIQTILQKKLSSYFNKPQITIQIAKFRNKKLFVLGEVKTPGVQSLTDVPLSILDAISAAGGLDLNNADPSHIYVIRGSAYHPFVYWLNANSPGAMIVARQFMLYENDIVYVSSATLSGVNRFLNQILPSLTIYALARDATE